MPLPVIEPPERPSTFSAFISFNMRQMFSAFCSLNPTKDRASRIGLCYMLTRAPEGPCHQRLPHSGGHPGSTEFTETKSAITNVPRSQRFSPPPRPLTLYPKEEAYSLINQSFIPSSRRLSVHRVWVLTLGEKQPHLYMPCVPAKSSVGRL